MDIQDHTTPGPKLDSDLDMGKILSARRRSPRVLVVDDNPDIVLLMQELLASRGYDAVAVSRAATGDESAALPETASAGA